MTLLMYAKFLNFPIPFSHIPIGQGSHRPLDLYGLEGSGKRAFPIHIAPGSPAIPGCHFFCVHTPEFQGERFTLSS